MKPIERACAIAGSQRALARSVGVTVQAVNQWIKTQTPAERCLAIESVTQGIITRYALRPDVFGPEPDEAAA